MAFSTSYFGKGNDKGKGFASSYNTTPSPSPNAPDVSGYNATNNNDTGSTVVNNNNDYNTDNTKSVPKQNNPYLYGGTTSEDLADVGFTGVGNPSTEKRQETSGYNPNDNQGGTMTETSNDDTVTTTTNVLGDNPNTTVTTPDNNNETETKTEGEGEDDIFTTPSVFVSVNCTYLINLKSDGIVTYLLPAARFDVA